MQTAYHPIGLRKGATSDVTMALTVDGAPVDLGGYTITIDVRDVPDETGTLILRLTNTLPDPLPTTYPVCLLEVNEEAGTIRRLIDADTSALLAAGAYHYDLRMENAGGTVDYLIYGPFTVARRVTP